MNEQQAPKTKQTTFIFAQKEAYHYESYHVYEHPGEVNCHQH